MAFYRRSAWTTTTNQAVPLKRKQVHLTFHHPGFGNPAVKTAGWSLKRCFDQLRAWRNMHVGSGAYKEVAYNLYALPTGDVAEGRGVHRQNGANGTSASNRAGLSIQVLKGDTEALTTKMIGAIFDAMAIAEKAHPGIVARQYGHRHWVSTTCPGSTVQERIPFKPGTLAAPAPAKQRPWQSSPLVQGMSAAEVRTVQKALADRGYDLGKYGVDGKYGEATYNAVRAAQKALGVAVDGIAGPDTMSALTAAAKPAAKPAARPKAPAFPLPRDGRGLFYYGPRSGPHTSVSGQTRNTVVPHDVVQVAGRWRSKGLARWQQRMIDRGWNELRSAGGADGRFGATTEKVVRQFQKSKGLGVDGKIGPSTWAAAWTEKVT